MKKPAIALDKQAIVRFFADNGEKIAFGVVVCCFLYFVYAAIGLERNRLTPQELLTKAEKAEGHIKSFSADVPRKPSKPGDVIKRLIDNPITVAPFSLDVAWDPLVPDPRKLRSQPPVYPVAGLRGVAGRGSFQRSGGGLAGAGAAAADANLGERYVVLTGVVDNQKQIAAFDECFRDTVKIANQQQPDRPVYCFFWVQRAEVTSDNEDPASLKWVRPYTSLEIERNKYGGGTADKTSDNYRLPALVFPLPSRTDGRDWGDEVVHAPEIPLVVASGDGMAPGPNPLQPENPDAPADPSQPVKPTDPDEPNFAPGGMGGMGGENMNRGPGAGMAGGLVTPGGGGGGLMAPGGGFAGGMGGGGMGVGGMSEAQAVTPQLLFRFFDYNVEPGKRYRYRVRIGLMNPNHNIPTQYLSPAVLAQSKDPAQWKPYIQSEWCEMNEVIAVPRDDRLLAASVDSRRGSGKVMVVHWDEKKGTEVGQEFDVSRGMIANFLKQKLPQPGGASEMAGGPALAGGEGLLAPGLGGQARPGGPGAAGQPTVPEETIDYVTDMLVLDLRGGERLPGKNRDLYRPGEILLLDPAGFFHVHSDQGDAKERDRLSGAASAMPGGFPGGMPGGPARGGPGLLEP